jgi:hypothetical protein
MCNEANTLLEHRCGLCTITFGGMKKGYSASMLGSSFFWARGWEKLGSGVWKNQNGTLVKEVRQSRGAVGIGMLTILQFFWV